MNKMKLKTLTRQAEISKTCRTISHLTVDAQIAHFSEFLTCLSNANMSQICLGNANESIILLFLFTKRKLFVKVIF